MGRERDCGWESHAVRAAVISTGMRSAGNVLLLRDDLSLVLGICPMQHLR